MPSDRAEALDEVLRRELGLDDDVDLRHVQARRDDAVGHLVLAAERALRAHRSELAVLLCLAACRSGASVEGALEEVLSAAFASVRCLRVAPDAHPGGAYAVAWSPDDVMLASGGADARVVLWAGEEARPVATLKGHEDRIRRIEFNEVWPLVSTCGDDGAVIVWDVASRAAVWRVQGTDASALAARFSPCGRWIAIAGGTAWSGLRDARTGDVVFGFAEHDGVIVYDAVFSSDGRRVASCGDDGRAIVWDAASGAVVGRTEHEKQVRSVAFDISGGRVACGSYDGAASVLTIETGARRVFEGDGRVHAASFVNGGRDLWIVREQGAQLLIENIGQESEQQIALGSSDAQVLSTCIRREGRITAFSDQDGVACVREARAGRFETVAVLRSAGAATLGVDLTSDGARAATADADGAVRIWSLRAKDTASRTLLRGPALLAATSAWRRSSGRAPSRRELELLALDEASAVDP